MDAVVTLIKEFGPYVTLILFFMYRDYRRESGQALYTQQLVKNIVEIATDYSTTTQAVVDATNASTRCSGKTYNLLIRLLKQREIYREPADSSEEDSRDELLPSAQNLTILSPSITDLHLNLTPKELKNDWLEIIKTKR